MKRGADKRVRGEESERRGQERSAMEKNRYLQIERSAEYFNWHFGRKQQHNYNPK